MKLPGRDVFSYVPRQVDGKLQKLRTHSAMRIPLSAIIQRQDCRLSSGFASGMKKTQ